MKEKLAALKAIFAATTRKDVNTALESIGRAPSGLLAQEVRDQGAKKLTRILVAIFATLSILTTTVIAYIGGGFISEYAGPVAIIFGVLDITIVALLAFGSIKGKARIGLVSFEILSILYLGYAMGGYFGSGNASTAAEKVIAADYVVLKDHYSNTETVSDLMKRAMANARSVADVESQRDGKGVVYEKASFIAAMKIDTIAIPPALPEVPTFDGLSAANKWVQAERQKVTDRISKYDAVFSAIKNQAKGTNESLQQAIAFTLSQEQKSNLQVLAASMQEIANKEASASKAATTILSPSDLKADGFQGWIGFIIDGVNIFFIVVLALQKDPVKGIDAIKEQEAKALMEDMLSDEGIAYENETFEGGDAKKLHEVIKRIFTSDSLLKYLKSGTSFDDYIQFNKLYPRLGHDLENSQWTIRDIEKEIRKDPGFIDIAEHAITFSPLDWRIVKATINSPEELAKLDTDKKMRFLKTIKSLQAKNIKDAELKSFMGQFLLEENPSVEFINNLEAAISVIKSVTRIKYLSSDFINNADPQVVSYVCKTIENDKKFEAFMQNWNSDMNNSFASLLQSSLAKQPNFDKLIKLVVVSGVPGFRYFIDIFNEKSEHVEGNEFGSKTLVIAADLSPLSDALSGENWDDVFSAINKSLLEKKVGLK